MAEKGRNTTVVRNRKAQYEYFIIDKIEVGMMLQGTEVKSLRASKVNLQEAYCFLKEGELFIQGMNISPYENGTYNNHAPTRVRKLLLKKKEIIRLERQVETKGMTIVPIEIYFNERNFAKLLIGISKGKKSHDKRESIKEKDLKRDMDRQRLDL